MDDKELGQAVVEAGIAWDRASRALDRAELREREAAEDYIQKKAIRRTELLIEMFNNSPLTAS